METKNDRHRTPLGKGLVAQLSPITRLPYERHFYYETPTHLLFTSTDKLAQSYRAIKFTKHNELLKYEVESYSDSYAEVTRRIDQLGRLVSLGAAWGVIGFVRFLKGYYLLLITKRSRVGRVGPHVIYEVRDTVMLSLLKDQSGISIMSGSDDESKYTELMKALNMGDNFFYFSYTYDLTNTLQTNMVSAREGDDDDEDAANLQRPRASSTTAGGGNGKKESSGFPLPLGPSGASRPADSKTSHVHTTTTAKPVRRQFLWNEYLLEPLQSDFEQIEGAGGLSGATPTNVGAAGGGKGVSSGSSGGDDGIPPTTLSTTFAISGYNTANPILPLVVHLIQGYVVHSKVNTPSGTLPITLIARKSKYFAGSRYLKRGIIDSGHVANHVEVEQIVCLNSSLSKCQTKGRFSSFVQCRGSVPVHWYHPPTKRPQPPVKLSTNDPLYRATRKHFGQLIEDFGAPVFIVNLLKRQEGKRRERILTEEYEKAVITLSRGTTDDALGHAFTSTGRGKTYQKQKTVEEKKKNSFRERRNRTRSQIVKEEGEEKSPLVNDDTGDVDSTTSTTSSSSEREEGDDQGELHHKEPCILHYRSFDLRNNTDQAWNTITSLAEASLEETSFFSCDEYTHVALQEGIARSNCVDCIDRTNFAQTLIGLNVLGHQLEACGCLKKHTDISQIPVVQREFFRMFLDVGDALAVQYGGSQTVGVGGLVDRGRAWDRMMEVQRLYNNLWSDGEKQTAINVFLGLYRPCPLKGNPLVNSAIAATAANVKKSNSSATTSKRSNEANSSHSLTAGAPATSPSSGGSPSKTSAAAQAEHDESTPSHQQKQQQQKPVFDPAESRELFLPKFEPPQGIMSNLFSQTQDKRRVIDIGQLDGDLLLHVRKLAPLLAPEDHELWWKAPAQAFASRYRLIAVPTPPNPHGLEGMGAVEQPSTLTIQQQSPTTSGGGNGGGSFGGRLGSNGFGSFKMGSGSFGSGCSVKEDLVRTLIVRHRVSEGVVSLVDSDDETEPGEGGEKKSSRSVTISMTTAPPPYYEEFMRYREAHPYSSTRGKQEPVLYADKDMEEEFQFDSMGNYDSQLRGSSVRAGIPKSPPPKERLAAAEKSKIMLSYQQRTTNSAIAPLFAKLAPHMVFNEYGYTVEPSVSLSSTATTTGSAHVPSTQQEKSQEAVRLEQRQFLQSHGYDLSQMTPMSMGMDTTPLEITPKYVRQLQMSGYAELKAKLRNIDFTPCKADSAIYLSCLSVLPHPSEWGQEEFDRAMEFCALPRAVRHALTMVEDLTAMQLVEMSETQGEHSFYAHWAGVREFRKLLLKHIDNLNPSNTFHFQPPEDYGLEAAVHESELSTTPEVAKEVSHWTTLHSTNSSCLNIVTNWLDKLLHPDTGIPLLDRVRYVEGESTSLKKQVPTCSIVHACFNGSQFMSWVVRHAEDMNLKLQFQSDMMQRAADARRFLTCLLRGGLLHHVSTPTTINGLIDPKHPHAAAANEHTLYRFFRSDERMVLNEPTPINKCTLLGQPCQLAESLVNICFQFFEEELDSTGVSAAGKKSAKSAALEELARQSVFLQGVDLSLLYEPEVRMSFFINIYNSLYIHLWLHAQTQPALDYAVACRAYMYNVGGYHLSLQDIKHGILRGNRHPPHALLPQFLEGDPRKSLSIELSSPNSADLERRVLLSLMDVYLSPQSTQESEHHYDHMEGGNTTTSPGGGSFWRVPSTLVEGKGGGGKGNNSKSTQQGGYGGLDGAGRYDDSKTMGGETNTAMSDNEEDEVDEEGELEEEEYLPEPKVQQSSRPTSLMAWLLGNKSQTNQKPHLCRSLTPEKLNERLAQIESDFISPFQATEQALDPVVIRRFHSLVGLPEYGRSKEEVLKRLTMRASFARSSSVRLKRGKSTMGGQSMMSSRGGGMPPVSPAANEGRSMRQPV